MFSEELREAAKEIIEQICDHPCVRSLRDGNEVDGKLIHAYQRWLFDDYSYLKDGYLVAIRACSRQTDVVAIRERMEREEAGGFQNYLCTMYEKATRTIGEIDAIILPATQEYIEFVRNETAIGNFVLTFTVMFACISTFCEIGAALATATIHEDFSCRFWIEEYTAEQNFRVREWYTDTINTFAAKLSGEEKFALKEAFYAACGHELKFLQAIWEEATTP